MSEMAATIKTSTWTSYRIHIHMHSNRNKYVTRGRGQGGVKHELTVSAQIMPKTNRATQISLIGELEDRKLKT